MNTDIQIRNYLGGRMESGLLLIGSQTTRMLDDAAKVASSVLSIEATGLNAHPDFLRISPAEGKSLGVNDIMPILTKAQLQPAISDRQVVIVERFDKMSVQAQNKLLKLIEESELLVIGTALEDKVLPTIKSRMRVVTYSPMSFTEFCGKVGDGTSLLPRYFAVKGDPDAEPDKEVFDIFCKVEECIKSGNALNELFVILSLLGEKDNGNFYTQHKDMLPALISLIGKLYADKGDSRVVSLCRTNREKCNLPSYTNNDFFMFVSEVVI